jgi:GNAT superfamily N-acetyltransferase
MTARVAPRLRDLTSADAVRILEITRDTGVFREEELAVADEVFHDAVAATGRLGGSAAPRPEAAPAGKKTKQDKSGAKAKRPSPPAAAPPALGGSEPPPERPYYALGAELKGELVGWICWGRTPCTEGTWDLYWLAVDPAKHRHGVASALLAEMERRLAGVARLISIDTSGRADYGPTRQFYSARGYKAVATVPDFYAPGDDQIIFTKALTGPSKPRI